MEMKVKQCGCLNRNEDSRSVLDILNKEEDQMYLESDCDEQLLLFLEFEQPCSLKEIHISGPDDGRAPRSVKVNFSWYLPSFIKTDFPKLFVNRLNLDFSSIEDEDADQELEFIQSTQTLPIEELKYADLFGWSRFLGWFTHNQQMKECKQLEYFCGK